MQSLRVVGRLFPEILSGEKRATIRWREITIVPGFMRYIHDGDAGRTAIVYVTKCARLPLSQAASYLGREEDWSRDVMLSGMREHYPGINWDDEVQIVEHLSPAETAKRADFPG
ncbi:MAG: ASCH domain-containing protein [Rhizobiaceae bacterium]|nr:ASCH domain-containing protein [Rhizobiaceae bacterium]